MEPSRTHGTDRLLLLQVALVLALVVTGGVVYWLPAAEGPLHPRWWHWLIVGALFFAVVWIGAIRRRRRAHANLHEAIRESTMDRQEEEA